MKNYRFNKRTEVIEFLKGYDFKYYIPRLSEIMDACPSNLKQYYIEVTDNNKINYCAIEKKEYSSISINIVPFYDCNKAFNFPNAEQGEENYIEWLEIKEYEKEYLNEKFSI